MDMGLHAQLCAALAAAHKEEDARCAAAMARLAEAAPAEVGADPAVRCDLGAAVAELRTLGGQPTPLDKVAVLRRAAAAVAEAVEAGRRSGSVPPDTALAQDDLLPLLIATVARARPPRLYSEACLVQHFAPGRAAGASGSGSEADFHAANLRAAADHLVGLAPRGAARPARAAPPAAPPRRSPPAGAASPAELLLPGLDGAPPRARAAAAPKHAPAGGGRAGAARAGAEPCGDMGWGVGGGGGGGGEPRARVLARGVAPAGGGGDGRGRAGALGRRRVGRARGGRRGARGGRGERGAGRLSAGAAGGRGADAQRAGRRAPRPLRGGQGALFVRNKACTKITLAARAPRAARLAPRAFSTPPRRARARARRGARRLPRAACPPRPRPARRGRGRRASPPHTPVVKCEPLRVINTLTFVPEKAFLNHCGSPRRHRL